MQGFTLVEIAIVLVVIGLVVGGILVGRDLIRAAELRSVISDVEKYKAAVNTFRLKFNALPGDMLDATTYWGAADPNPTTCKTTIGTGTQTCNGNGDWKNGYPPAPNPGPFHYENYRFWQHLANAGLINGQDTGVGVGAGNSNAQVGRNVPASRISGAGYSIENAAGYGTIVWAGEYWPATDASTSIMEFGSNRTDDILNNPAITAQEAYGLDSKIDDGLPASGSVLSFMLAMNPGCITSDTPSISRYTTSKSIVCTLVFKNVFGY
jgi:prepilin-type N-terminal cleavage/methylation domain-containing protein